MVTNRVLIFITCLPWTVLFCATPYEAITIVPVADLLGQSMATIQRNNAIERQYTALPICAKNNLLLCPRTHQLLFNEQVTVVEEMGTELCVRVPHLFFNTKKDTECHTLFWTLKKNVIPLTNLQKKGIPLEKLPQPLRFSQKNTVPSQSIVTLLMPYHDPATHTTFSAGTRFVTSITQQPANRLDFPVYILEPHNVSLVQTTIPARLCIHAHTILSPKEKQAFFIRILQTWAHGTTKHQFIPYVWGGCSFITQCKKQPFITHEHKKTDIIYERTDAQKPYNGFDCAGLIIRAAQIAGMPYFFKNSITIAQHLKPLTHEEKVHNGDIIWFSGHVMVISDVAKNTIIEARHYSHGYGKVHEIRIDRVFHNVHSIEQLKERFHADKPLYRMNSKGAVVQTIPHFKILSLHSIWD